MDKYAGSQLSCSAPAKPEASTSGQATEAGAQQAANAKLRKRTKTGCLTCRRRRIKCGEERPICTNCVRSRRPCDGYNQRLVFKNAMEGWSGMMETANIIPHHTSSIPEPSEFVIDYTYAERQTHYGIPIDKHGRPSSFPAQQGVSTGWPSVQYTHQKMGTAACPPAYGSIPPTPTSVAPHGRSQYMAANVPLQSPGPLMSPFYQESPFRQSFDNTSPLAHPFSSESEHVNHYTRRQTLPTPITSAYAAASAGFSSHGPEHDPGYFAFQTRPSIPHNVPTPLSAPIYSSSESHGFEHKPGISRRFTGAPIAIESFVPPTTTHYPNNPNNHDLQNAAVEWQHEDYDSPWDSDEDAEFSPQQRVVQTQQNHEHMKMVMELSRNYSVHQGVLDYSSLLYSGFLTEYEAEKFASPLRNHHTARVFAHFLASTASSISIFERAQPHNSTFLDGRVPIETYPGTWNYTLPAMALQHQGLLHAMLSLSSLHISKLQNDAPTPAFKHYGYAIKRVNRCVQHPDKRHNLTTLAATLLLGFYEVMTADHTKWCCHLSGAARLLQEIDFAWMAMQASIAQGQETDPSVDASGSFTRQQKTYQAHRLDKILISKIVGNNVTPGQSQGVSIVPFDLQQYHIYQDMFWWYARQDVYQSIIAGNRLMLKYHRWSSCPPRTSMGRIDAIYGTHDHLFLLLGRIADFSARDRERKLKAMSVTGGTWRPHPDMKMPSRPPTGPPQSRKAPQGSQPTSLNQAADEAPTTRGPPAMAPAMPSFYGLAPMPTKISLPTSYSTNATMPPLKSPVTEKPPDSLDAQTRAAIAEWSQMYSALHELKAHFGPGFAPISTPQQPFNSPFGPTIVYASYGISVLWALYYAAHIVALRAHPHMPPFAHVAAGVAAAQTGEYSNMIGRIAAGMMVEPLRPPLNPVVGATFCEVSMPLFIAGIQYTDPAQRHWVVSRTREIESLTGWASVGMIGQGCERAWIKTAAAGMGPPYTPLREDLSTHDSSSMRVPRVGNGRPNASQHWASQPPDADPRGMRIHLAMGLLSNENDLDAEAQAVRHERSLSHTQDPHSSSVALPFRSAA